MSGKLDNAIVYLSGSMENDPNFGMDWRKKFISITKENKLNLHIIDPTNKPGSDEFNLGEDRDLQEKLQREGRFDELKKHVARYRHFDLRYVDISDIMVVNIQPKIASWGTANEIYLAESQKKPRLAICEGGLYKMPRWLFDVFNFNDIFENMEDLICRLIKINNGEYPVDDRWILIRKYIDLL